MHTLPDRLIITPPAEQVSGDGVSPDEKEGAAPRLTVLLRGPERTLLANVTQALPYSGPESLDVLDLGDTYNGVRIWALDRGQTDSIHFFVEGAFAVGGPWFIIPAASPDGRYSAFGSNAFEIVTAARFVRVRPVFVTGVWDIIATPFLALTTSSKTAGFRAKTQVYTNIDLSSTGVKVTYSTLECPSQVTWVTFTATGGTAQLEYSDGTNAVPIAGPAQNFNQGLNVYVAPFHSLQLRVTTTGLNATGTLLLSVVRYEVVG